MAQQVQIAIDCADPELLASFWSVVLGYQLAEPPDGHATWADHAKANAEEPGESWCRIADPAGRGPRLLFHRVPEAKAVKNRVHLDVRAPDGAPGDRRQQVDAFIDKLIGHGARRLRDVTDEGGFFSVLADPEGNEFCTG